MSVTMETSKEIKTTLRINKEIWEKFKKICKENETDASKEIRKFIKNFLKDHQTKT